MTDTGFEYSLLPSANRRAMLDQRILQLEGQHFAAGVLLDELRALQLSGDDSPEIAGRITQLEVEQNACVGAILVQKSKREFLEHDAADADLAAQRNAVAAEAPTENRAARRAAGRKRPTPKTSAAKRPPGTSSPA